MDPDFAGALARCLDEIPRGRVATCGGIARALGDVRAARAVATWLGEHPEIPGGDRVIRADGRRILRHAAGRVDPSRIVQRLPRIALLGRLRAEQRRLASQVVERDEGEPIELVAGVDVAYRGPETFAAAVSLDIEKLEPVEIVVARGRAEFPYIPTYLAYREFPAVNAAVTRLRERPDVMMIDGHGRLHPALFGVACYAGVRLGLRTIGAAKHPLAGRRRSPTRREPDALPLEIDGVIRGYEWTPPGRGRPIYVSVGHRISLESALDLVRRTTRRGIPESLRVADRVAREMKRNEKREKGAKR